MGGGDVAHGYFHARAGTHTVAHTKSHPPAGKPKSSKRGAKTK